jgi:hypothetical protein
VIFEYLHDERACELSFVFCCHRSSTSEFVAAPLLIEAFGYLCAELPN